MIGDILIYVPKVLLHYQLSHNSSDIINFTQNIIYIGQFHSFLSNLQVHIKCFNPRHHNKI
jgi:hypothetical protein